MVTRFRVGTNRLVERLTLHVSSVSPLPRSYREAFNDVNWQSAMRDEYNALIKNSTWTLVPRPPDVNVVRCMWLFRYKCLADGMLNGSTQLEVHHLDVKNAFLRGDLSEIVYMHQPFGFRESTHPDYVCLLQRSLYGIKQAPHAWFQRFESYITRVGFYQSHLLHQIISSLHQEFAMTDLASLTYFLGISVTRDSSVIRTPVDTEFKLGTTGDVVSDPTLYQSLAGYCSILLLLDPISLMLFSRCVFICMILGSLTFSPLSGSCAMFATLSRSSAEVEYRGVSNVVAETCWLRNLLRELHTPLSSVTFVYCDNVSVIYLSSNPVQHQRTKHIEIDIHFVRDLVATGQVWVLHVPYRYQFADIFTKDLPSALLEEFRSSLSVRCLLAQTARKCCHSICDQPYIIDYHN
uniref:Reverse transcriptase Ty1/copia-type domain-containing protein n=1 Tax=Tanacetum cinerariifolium TaxID=118510 RepID=A0A699HRH9_TANCI|nr:hypothetical protein [Tanacetum cinerariifolium]